jgi:hypothetical protein
MLGTDSRAKPAKQERLDSQEAGFRLMAIPSPESCGLTILGKPAVLEAGAVPVEAVESAGVGVRPSADLSIAVPGPVTAVKEEMAARVVMEVQVATAALEDR